ncbi:MAG: peptidoglycan DD-metalloendopeptidase family protein [Alphaproteobacteria bacterium]|nr:peptidoglycan DD-metalloendopeptidase family protein [Alphaproteobacteria bacterium]
MCVFAATTVPAVANTELAKIQSQIRQTEQQNKKLEEQVKKSDKNIAQTKQDLVRTADRVSSLEEQRGKMQTKIEELDAQREKIARELAANQSRIMDAISGMLFMANHPNFDVDDMHEYVLASSVLSGMSQQFDTEIQKASRQLDELAKIIDARNVEKEKLDRSAKKYTLERNALDKLLKSRSAQNEKLKSQQIALQKKLRALSEKAKSISELSAGVGSSEMSADERFSRRKLNLPVRGRIIVRFGEKTALGLTSDGWRIKTRGDVLVTAPADGIVKFADTFRGFGRVVIISHKNGYNTVITNMGRLDVVPEQEVLAGEPIGRISADKSETYMEVRRGKKAVDPARLFKEEN